MPDQTFEAIRTEHGYDFIRSDGQRFSLVTQDNGHAVLYAGTQDGSRPAVGIVDLDVSISDKLAAARRWVLAYPNHPETH
jgi:hypothetical protein